VDLLDLQKHSGVHPRFGVVDVVPFVVLPSQIARGVTLSIEDWTSVDIVSAVGARDRFVEWAASALDVPCFAYGPRSDGAIRTLPDVRRHAFTDLQPDAGPLHPHLSAGAVAVGARRPLVAYNLWLTGADIALARHLAAAIRSPQVRALGLATGQGVQVSCNLVEPFEFGPAEALDTLSRFVRPPCRIVRAELVGLLPGALLDRIPPERWRQLDVSPGATIEARLADASIRRR
jgi:glutamate formiminotransferase